MIFLNLAAAKNPVRPNEGVAEGGGWGEEFRSLVSLSEARRWRGVLIRGGSP
ncbi:MAG: hypothetical protein US88_C0023G0005 [Parcubacteria group bacterium GW2011_GWA2_38_27]|nr:MAG: hypothetical protein US88_C0023G0005 [Parcubacteria group bacterium GW2011_GWA2_38_27]